MRAAIAAWALMTLLLPAGARAAVVPQRNWRQIQTVHFRVLGDVSPRALRQVGERLERLHAVLSMFAGRDDSRPVDTTVLVFRDLPAYTPFVPLYDGQPASVSGYFQPGPMNYITLTYSQESEQDSIVYHEYVHLALDRAIGHVPVWAGEGLAEFYSTFSVVDGGKKVRLGDMLQYHLWTMQQAMVPLDVLTSVTHDSPLYNERSKKTVFYAQSWALVHYLQLGNKGRYAPQFGRFMKAIIDGAPFAEACTAILGVTPAVLEAELKRYAFAPVLYRSDVPLPTALARIERLEPSAVPEADVHAVLGDLLVRIDRGADGRVHLEHALKTVPDHALALGALAQLEREEGHADQARALARRPTSGATFQSEYYRAEVLEPRATADDDVAPVVEEALRRSIALNPTFAPALVRLSRHLDETPEHRAEALQLITKAIALAPARDDYRLQLARLQLLARQFAPARTVLGPLAARGSTTGIRAAARDLLGYSARAEAAAVADADDRAAAGTPPEIEAIADTPGRTGDPAGGTTVYDLRPVGAGEVREFGRWVAIECQPDEVVLVVEVAGRTVRVRADALDKVAFVTFRAEPAGSVTCGPQRSVPLFLTFRPDLERDTVGVALAVELLPDGYTP